MVMDSLATVRAMDRSQRIGPIARAAVALWVGLASSCSRTIEEDDPPVLVEHRIEPCRQWCEPMLSRECGRVDEPRPYATIDECIETCAAAEPGGWDWGRQEDGTDACAEEWFLVADCMDALTCEEQRSYFRRPWGTEDYPCKEELDARSHCFESTPSLDNPDGGR